MAGDLRRALGQPRLAWNYLRRWSLLAKFAGVSRADVRRYKQELVADADFQGHLDRNLGEARGFFGRAPELYVLTRALKPEVVVETGVASGVSSAHILRALEANGRGTLYSIDLPNKNEGVLVPSGREPGWIIPAGLRGRWKLEIGDTRALLPALLSSLPKVDVFFHDSDHSYEAMLFEYEAAAPKLRPGGLLLSDDTNYNRAYDDFCAKNGLNATRVVHMGVTRVL